MTPWAGKSVLITGCCGTIGEQLVEQLLAADVGAIVGLDNSESALFFQRERHANDSRVELFLGDVRDPGALRAHAAGCQVILHTAALKHVVLCERSPSDAVATNIHGVANVIAAGLEAGVERVLFTSSDKAVNPTNVMGTSKLMGERLITAANAQRRSGGPIFASTRFGNVLGSRGSVMPLFRRQIRAGGPVTLTDPAMSRFIMTLEEAVRLVMESTFLACGGEVFVTKMPAVRISDLATIMIEELAPHYGHDPRRIELAVIGAKAGEKLYEELLNEEEIRRSSELARYFVVKPAFRAMYEEIRYDYPEERGAVQRPYNSAVEPTMDREALRTYLRERGLLNRESAP